MADPDLQIKGKGGGRVGGGWGEGGGHPDPEIRGAGGGRRRSQKDFFLALWASVWSNPSLDPPLVLTSKNY